MCSTHCTRSVAATHCLGSSQVSFTLTRSIQTAVPAGQNE
jgi:hypothetical protein